MAPIHWGPGSRTATSRKIDQPYLRRSSPHPQDWRRLPVACSLTYLSHVSLASSPTSRTRIGASGGTFNLLQSGRVAPIHYPALSSAPICRRELGV
jgi:hypothetical protein